MDRVPYVIASSFKLRSRVVVYEEKCRCGDSTDDVSAGKCCGLVLQPVGALEWTAGSQSLSRPKLMTIDTGQNPTVTVWQWGRHVAGTL